MAKTPRSASADPLGAGDWRDFSTPAMPHTMETSLGEFVREGFHGASIRSLAEAAGMSVPGLYHHYRSKDEILQATVGFAMADLLWRSRAALEEAGERTTDRFDRMVECLVLFHANRPGLAFLASSEIRSLRPDARRAHIEARDRQQRLLDEVVESGVREGVFACDEPALVSRAIVTMCTGVAQWYRPDGPLTADAIAADYVALARRAVAAR